MTAAARTAANGSKAAATLGPNWVNQVLGLWYGQFGPSQWFTGGVDVDDKCRVHYNDIWECIGASPAPPHGNPNDLASYCSSTPRECFTDPQAALAGVIVYDQAPRNMFRRTARAFQTDAHALALSKYAVAKGLDKGLKPEEKMFLYMPYMHSEVLQDQEDAVVLFGTVGGDFQAEQDKFAKEHRDIIAKYGRFPHRNAVLGRESTPEEIKFLQDHDGFGQ
ncbi:uncharacterized protein CcaverHIS019_0300790 [Cutaneotrichosporon cavernicola]|uniref:DUF924-domain-containing protein n=1 Tax=Cutaneotrichosporon cavernicola TaxID=279322 RepID=A0AA48I2I5_9TREE|nr:uncharacterized protein CcaverHIS019_0300790 [Cutaneotrichosporon cavernicola]BEI90009.1 hypothetical protein CcaverHIS019_0300790 [Cutaneotrichosporon cavernicola]BEI97782.1 hypothetical protein CcaverHIS631_0300810 [Cutaneotrichosporon cavernicola]BEJ05560.1 hypothetical protein CcaverHIS641_0300820 [Cutaneotrichosporon cavernicola]